MDENQIRRLLAKVHDLVTLDEFDNGRVEILHNPFTGDIKSIRVVAFIREVDPDPALLRMFEDVTGVSWETWQEMRDELAECILCELLKMIPFKPSQNTIDKGSEVDLQWDEPTRV
jgi:hypothetical protein